MLVGVAAVDTETPGTGGTGGILPVLGPNVPASIPAPLIDEGGLRILLEYPCIVGEWEWGCEWEWEWEWGCERGWEEEAERLVRYSDSPGKRFSSGLLEVLGIALGPELVLVLALALLPVLVLPGPPGPPAPDPLVTPALGAAVEVAPVIAFEAPFAPAPFTVLPVIPAPLPMGFTPPPASFCPSPLCPSPLNPLIPPKLPLR